MYYVVYFIAWLFSLLPLWILYRLADFIALVLFYLVPYRKKLVLSNLATAFPDKTSAERKKIAKHFYRNFVDHFLETVKLISAGKNFLNKHFVIDNPEILEPYRSEGRRCQLQLGHSFNWEYANNAFAQVSGQPLIVIYMPIGNRIFNRLMNHIRSKTGAIQIPATDARKKMLAFRHQPYILTLVADQAPGSPEIAYWLNFFGKPTPFVKSPERGARSGNTAAIFVHFYKSSRGKYRAKLFSGSEAPGNLPEGELTRRYVKFLEWSIREQPALYLWSHNRWKYPWKPEYQSLLID